jgi:hypothetical protein
MARTVNDFSLIASTVHLPCYGEDVAREGVRTRSIDPRCDFRRRNVRLASDYEPSIFVCTMARGANLAASARSCQNGKR